MGLLLNPHRLDTPASAWVRRWSSALLAPHASVLDVACGSGRHLRWLAGQGFKVTGVDRDAEALQALHSLAEVVVADIENGPWPFAGRRFDAIVVTNYLWRPTWPTLLASLAERGVLIYETFAEGQESIGRPSRPEFLLRHGELLALCQGLRIVAYEDGFEPDPARFVQRIAAVSGAASPGRHLLSGPSVTAG